MADKLTWDSFDDLAVLLQKKFPDTKLLFLKDERLLEMIETVDVNKELPAPPTNAEKLKDVCFCIRIAWTRLKGQAATLSAPVETD